MTDEVHEIGNTQQALIDGFKEVWDLSNRELDLLYCLADGLTSTKAIAEKMACSESTVNNYVNSICKKSNSHGRIELLSKWLSFSRKLYRYIEKPKISWGTCYISEDESSIAEILADIVSEIGFKPVLMQEVRGPITATGDDLVIYDLSFETNAMERVLTQALKGIGPGIIAVTGNDRFLAEKGHRFHWDKLILKPFNRNLPTEIEQLAIKGKVRKILCENEKIGWNSATVDHK